jgi:hypothetical protein
VHVIASRCAVIASTPTAFVDVFTGVSGLAIVDDVITDTGRFVPSWGGIRMNLGLFLLSGGLRRLLRCKPRRLEAKLSACCMAAASRKPRISSWAQRASGVDGSDILWRSMAAATMF